jgi:23S rRNA (guanine2445-N2)-methyltransferase / 23S rRNA (guanine2069-N7)-methyltransferase
VATFSLQVRTVTGLEGVLADELVALGARDVSAKRRVVLCHGDRELLYRANLWCRTAIRTLVPLVTFDAPDEKALYDGLRAVDWSAWIAPNGTLAVDPNVHSSFSTHSLYLAQLTKDAIVDHFRARTGQRPSVDLDNPDLRVALSLYRNVATVSVDASGESLHKRGYRRKAGEAPLAETLAAGILKLTGWDGAVPLVDPMCGSGTFAIEAALLARNVAPGLFRESFGFQRWPDFDRALWSRLVRDAKLAVKRNVRPTLLAFDIDPAVVAIARENVARAGLENLVRVEEGDFFQWDERPEPPGMLVINPPYDERLPVDNVALLYQRLGDRLKRQWAGWKAFLLAGNLEAAKYVGLRASRRLPLYNGALECRLLEYELRELSAEAAAVEAPRWREKEAPELRPEWSAQAETFANRLRKTFKHESKWAERAGVTCWRVYDWDIPELPFVVDLYGDRLHVAEIQRNHGHSPVEHARWQECMVRAAGDVLGVPRERTYFKVRKPQQSGFQYTPHARTDEFVEVTEGGHRFLVNLADYLDVGLFLDHRNTRAMVEKEARDKDFLNLFAYTGSFTVYAAAGGAKSTTTVDTSATYLEWAEENLRRNGLLSPRHHFVRMDTFEFLEGAAGQYDLCVVDPPTRSVNRSSGRVFEVQEDHVRLLHLVLARMRPGGVVYFSTNYRNFTLDERGVRQGRSVTVEEISAKTIPPDFRRKPSHRAWRLELAAR